MASAPEANPPFYVLLAQSQLNNLPAGALSNNLVHPVIQYHYEDDSLHSLLPTHPNEHVLVLNYDHNSAQPTVQSISGSLSVLGLKKEEAPGAAASDEPGARNDAMYIIETISEDHSMTGSQGDRKSAQAILAQFKHRNSILRRALLYPSKSMEPPQIHQPAQEKSGSSAVSATP